MNAEATIEEVIIAAEQADAELRTAITALDELEDDDDDTELMVIIRSKRKESFDLWQRAAQMRQGL